VCKHRNLAAAAVVRKLTVSIWHLLMGHHTDMRETIAHLVTQLLKLATLLGKDTINQAGFARRDAFARHLLKSSILHLII
jgi:hypothetical protein